MISPKHPTKPLSNAKIVVLEIDQNDTVKVKNNVFKSHKLRKLQSIQTSRKSKAIKMFQKMDFTDWLLQKLPCQSLPVAPSSQRTHRSSYLAYKEQQKLNKVKHYNKLTCLQNKIIQHPISIDTHVLTRPTLQTYQQSRSKRKMSMVVLGQSLSEGNQEAALSKSRNIYIQTSYGKRQKIDPNIYMSKIKQKIQNLCDYEDNQKIASFTTNYIQTINDIQIKMQPFSQERHKIAQKIRARNFRKQQSLLKQEDVVNECRPWTSRNSDYPQQ